MTVDTIGQTNADLSALVIIEIDAMLGRTRVNGRRMTQAELARRLHKTPVWISDRMTGRVKLTVDDMALIADALGVGIVDLLPRDRRQITQSLLPEHLNSIEGHPRLIVPRRPLDRPPSMPSAKRHPPSGPRRTAPTGKRP